jgi:hypothetical protein
MLSANGDNLLLGRGKAYFDRKVNGLYTGLRFLGEASKLEINPQVTKKDRFTSTKKAATKIASVVVDQTHTITIDLMEYTPDNIALALLGDTALITQLATPVMGESLSAAAQPGRVYQTAKRLITAITVHAAGAAAVLGTDYTIEDATLGLIYVVPGGVFDGTKAMTIDYTPTALAAADAKYKVDGGLENLIEGKLIFVGDPANGQAFDLEAWKVRFSPAGALALITDDFGSIPLSGEVMDDSANHPGEPLYRLNAR